MKNKTASFVSFMILSLIVGAGFFGASEEQLQTHNPAIESSFTSISNNVFLESTIQEHLYLSWGDSNSQCNSMVKYAVIDFSGNETDLDKGECEGLLLSVESSSLASSLEFLKVHSNSFDAVIFDDYNPYYFDPYYSNFSNIIPVIPVENFPSYNPFTLKYSSSVIIPIGFGNYPNLSQSANIDLWNKTVVKFADQARSMPDFSNGGMHAFNNIFLLVYEHSTSFQSQWSQTYINGTILASEKFDGLVAWGGTQFSL